MILNRQGYLGNASYSENDLAYTPHIYYTREGVLSGMVEQRISELAGITVFTLLNPIRSTSWPPHLNEFFRFYYACVFFLIPLSLIYSATPDTNAKWTSKPSAAALMPIITVFPFSIAHLFTSLPPYFKTATLKSITLSCTKLDIVSKTKLGNILYFAVSVFSTG